jgi:hypothetical protein
VNKYTVTIQLEDIEQFQHFIDNIGPLVPSVVINVATGATASVRPAMRAKRVSKVNATILNALQNGSKSVGDLKQALAEAHLSPGSISTGLSQLQKAQQVERLGSGLYGLATAA